MRIASRMRWMLMVLVVVSLAMPASWVAAQGEDDDPEFGIEFEFEGTILSIDDDGILVDVEGIEFFLAPAGSFNPSMLSEGDLVQFNGLMLSDETIKVSALVIIEEAEEDPIDDPEDDDEDVDDPEDDDEDVDDPEDDDEDVEDPEDDDEDDEDSGVCANENHPVITALANSFELDYAVVMGYHCDGYGIGEIARALMLAEQTDQAAEDVFAMREAGMGWGNIVKELEVSPSSLAPGRIISQEKKDAKHGDSDDDDGDDVGEGEDEGEKMAPGNSANAPGQQKKNNDHGNSANAPGQQKKKK